jgi:hypothetical protein
LRKFIPQIKIVRQITAKIPIFVVFVSFIEGPFRFIRKNTHYGLKIGQS